MTAEMQLATVPPKETALQVYSAENGLEPYLQIIRAEIDGFVPDVSTRKGREAIASIAYKVARSKTALDNAGKELVAELKEVPKKIDAERRQAEAVERAAAAERQRQADEQARMKAEADAREKDRAHKGAVLKAAKEAVMATGITEDQAREVIKLIAAGGVPRVYISY